MVGDGTAHRTDQGNDDRDDTGRQGPISGGVVRTDLAGFGTDCQGFEPDRDQRTAQHCKGRVADIVENPGEFLRTEVLENFGFIQLFK